MGSTKAMTFLSALAVAGLALFGSGCSGEEKAGEGATSASGGGEKLSGEVKVDGSSTVSPISQAVSSEFKSEQPGVQVPVGEKGTGSGMKMFLDGEIPVVGASRPIEPEEIATAKEKGIEFIELPVALDGLTIVVNPRNDWLKSITVDELKKMWEPTAEGKVTTWNQINPSWPNQKFTLYGPTSNHGTFEYFTEVIVQKKKASRQDYQQNQEYNALIQGVSSDPNALGYVGYAYFEQNKDKVKAIPVDGGSGPVEPTVETISNGTYKPLSRPLFIYVNKADLAKPAVKAFVEFYIANAKELVGQVGYIPLPDTDYAKAKEALNSGSTGVWFSNKSE